MTEENTIYKQHAEEFEEQKQHGKEIMKKYYEDEVQKKLTTNDAKVTGQIEETSDLKESTHVKNLKLT